MNKKFGVGTSRRQSGPLVFVALVFVAFFTSSIMSACSVEVNSMKPEDTTPSPIVMTFNQPETPLVLAPTPTSTPTPTATPYPTNTPAPTSTPTPTATPYPTNTPVPTATPIPTATPVPTATPFPTSTPFPTGTPQPSSTAASFETSLMNRAADSISTLSTLHFILEIRQGKVVLSGADLKRAEGDLKRPDSYQASVKLKVVFADVTVKIFAQNGVQKMTDPITGRWSTSGPSETLNLVAMLDPKTGIGPVLRNLRNLQVVGSETLNNVSVYHVQGLASAAQVGQLTFNNLGKQEATIDAWIGQSDGLVRQLYLKENAPGNGFWALTFSNFNQPVEISQ